LIPILDDAVGIGGPQERLVFAVVFAEVAALEAWSIDATARAAKIIIDDPDRRPPELPGTIGEPVLTAPALGIVQVLIGRRLADVDKGAAAQMTSRGSWSLPAFPAASATAISSSMASNLGVGKEHLIERGIAAHLSQSLHRHTRLPHIDDKIQQTPMLRLVPIGARQQQSLMRLVSAGGPHLLPFHDPLIAAELSTRHRTGDVGTATRFAAQLAPDALAESKYAAGTSPSAVGSMLEDGRSSKDADPDLSDADGADALKIPPRPPARGRREGRGRTGLTANAGRSTRIEPAFQLAADHLGCRTFSMDRAPRRARAPTCWPR
jgi:hypothetical protein